MLNNIVYDFNLISVLLERISGLLGSCLLVKLLYNFSNTVGYALWKGNNMVCIHAWISFLTCINKQTALLKDANRVNAVNSCRIVLDPFQLFWLTNKCRAYS